MRFAKRKGLLSDVITAGNCYALNVMVTFLLMGQESVVGGKNDG